MALRLISDTINESSYRGCEATVSSILEALERGARFGSDPVAREQLEQKAKNDTDAAGEFSEMVDPLAREQQLEQQAKDDTDAAKFSQMVNSVADDEDDDKRPVPPRIRPDNLLVEYVKTPLSDGTFEHEVTVKVRQTGDIYATMSVKGASHFDSVKDELPRYLKVPDSFRYRLRNRERRTSYLKAARMAFKNYIAALPADNPPLSEEPRASILQEIGVRYEVPDWKASEGAAMHRVLFWKRGSTDRLPHAVAAGYTYAEDEELNIPPPYEEWDPVDMWPNQQGVKAEEEDAFLKECNKILKIWRKNWAPEVHHHMNAREAQREARRQGVRPGASSFLHGVLPEL